MNTNASQRRVHTVEERKEIIAQLAASEMSVPRFVAEHPNLQVTPGQIYSWRDRLKNPVAREGNYECKVCGYKTTSRGALGGHYAQAHPEHRGVKNPDRGTPALREVTVTPQMEGHHRTDEDRAAIVKRFHESCLTKKEFCKQEGIGVDTLRRWEERLQRQQHRSEQRNGTHKVEPGQLMGKRQILCPHCHKDIIEGYEQIVMMLRAAKNLASEL